MASDLYPTIMENESTGWTGWQQPVRKGYRLACCDCGLVHDFDFRVRDGRVQFKARRNNRSTGQLRRYRKHEKT